MPNSPSPEEIRALVGHRFPGGSYTIAHWENFLLTECTGAEPLPDGLAHPVALFHVPILGANTSIKEMFTLGQAESDFSIGIESYVWEIFQPLLEERRYRITGEVVEADRRSGDGRIFDRIAFRFEMFAPDEVLSARATITWHYRRSFHRTNGDSPAAGPSFLRRRRQAVLGQAKGFESNPSEQADLNKHVEPVEAPPTAAEPLVSPNGVRAGDEVPPWVMARVAPERMRTMAAILRDPNPVHWDPSVVEKLGFGHHTINQGPLGLSYMINMLHAWTGPRAIRRMVMRFPLVVLDGDHITARGRVTGIRQADGEWIADCGVWLEREGTEPPLEGTASVALSSP